MNALTLNTLQGKYFWGSWLIYSLAFAVFFMRTQYVEMAISSAEREGIIHTYQDTICATAECSEIKYTRLFDKDKKNYTVQVEVLHTGKQKPKLDMIQAGINDAIGKLAWYASSQFAKESKVIQTRTFEKKTK